MGLQSSYSDVSAVNDSDRYLTLDSGGATKNTTALTLKDYILAAGNVGTTAIADGAVTDVKRPRLLTAIVYDSGGQSLPNNTATNLTFGSEVIDAEGWHSTSTNTDRIVVSEAGLYRIDGYVSYDANATGQRGVKVTVNGSTPTGANYVALVVGNSGNFTFIPFSACFVLAASDIVRIQGYQNSGGALIMKGAYVSITKLSN